MDQILRESSPTHRDSIKTTFKPLQDLKFLYQQKSDTTSRKAQVSTELPIISAKTAHKRDFLTKTCSYTKTINEALIMKLKSAQLHDELSLIDLKMNRSTKKFHNAQSQHDNFAKSFEEFLTQQYEHVTDSLVKLEQSERESNELRNKLNQLHRDRVERSLKIYELEETWRKYKTSQNFLVHLSSLLQNDKKFHKEFRNLQSDETFTLEELMLNFEHLNSDSAEFREDDFKHLTARKIMEFLSKLKRQNLKILHYKLQYQKLTNILHDTDKFLEENFQSNFHASEKLIDDIQEKTTNVIKDVQVAQNQYEILEKKVLSLKEYSPLHTFIEHLYEKCFKMNPSKKSHLTMVKCIEDYCHLLFCALNSFDHNTIAKATSLSKK